MVPDYALLLGLFLCGRVDYREVLMTRQDILTQYTDEIMELVRLQVATRETIMSALNCALTEYAIVLIQLQQKSLTEGSVRND